MFGVNGAERCNCDHYGGIQHCPVSCEGYCAAEDSGLGLLTAPFLHLVVGDECVPSDVAILAKEFLSCDALLQRRAVGLDEHAHCRIVSSLHLL